MNTRFRSIQIDERSTYKNKVIAVALCPVGMLLVITIVISLAGYLSNPRKVFAATVSQSNALTSALSVTLQADPLPAGWAEKVSSILWVAYSPPTADPNIGLEATADAIRKDLAVLREAGFTGLVTYSSVGILGRELPKLAQAQGFQGIIMGIWDPANEAEIAAAKRAAQIPIVLGFCVGNEGLGDRYQMAELSETIQDLRQATGKPTTTTEQLDDYFDEEVLQVGDWIFPNVHPYFHNQLDPERAVRWTKAAYDDFKRRIDRFILFKEVGLPTAGDPNGKLSEAVQAQYYQKLAQTDVQFVYFEAFDQPWKTHLPIEPHWGVFLADRTPKLLGQWLMENPHSVSPTPTPVPAFYIYKDVDSPENHFHPTGYMGDTGDIHIDQAHEDNPHSGQTAIRIVYDVQGKGPQTCTSAPPCKWAGVYWQEPENNWGTDREQQGKGFDLSAYHRLVFWARADRPGTVVFKVGGIDEAYGDSLSDPRSKTAKLTQTWQEFVIDLSGADLTHIIGGFVWVTEWEQNPAGITFYLDDIRFETIGGIETRDSTTATATTQPTLGVITTKVTRQANLRAGPGTNYSVVGTARAGQEIVIAGQNNDGTWYQLIGGQWIAAFLVESVTGLVPAVERTPTPPSLLSPSPTSIQAFYIYRDADSPDNHFTPSGYMGDTGDIHIDEVYEENPHTGQSAIRIEYNAKGKGPNACPYDPPCRWAGVYWQEPPNNWGTEQVYQGKGFALSGYSRLVFWARSDRAGTIEFKVGGINEPYGDSLIYPRAKTVKLTHQWQEFMIDLSGADLSHIIGGFVWSANWEQNPAGITFYLDDIRFEK